MGKAVARHTEGTGLTFIIMEERKGRGQERRGKTKEQRREGEN